MSFNMNVAKSLVGRNVNLHLKDGSVIVNVLLKDVQKDEFTAKTFVKCVPYGKNKILNIPLKRIAWAELLNMSILTNS